mmetsp:Transcript_15914/g.40361  ORF Transcript_15914/g.40361 Transcript_15914/m.40361 type:complete len:84 (+) Transcript_15914:13-264(+)
MRCSSEGERMVWSPEQHLQSLEGEVVKDDVQAAQSLPMDLMSRNTITNMKENEKRIDYCTTTFKFVTNRIKCMQHLVGGPFLD